MKREELLLKPNWNYRDISFYCGCQKSKAYQIMKVAKQDFGGKVLLFPAFVKRDSVLLALGTFIERETYILNTLKKGGENEKAI